MTTTTTPAPQGEDFVRECTPTYTLERHIASLRDTDPEKWARLNTEWLSGEVCGG